MVHVYYTFLLSFHVERMRKSICNQSITIASLRDTVISQRTRMSSQSERMQNIQRKLEVKIINSFNVKIVIENFINFLDVLKKKIIMFIARTLLIKNSLNSRHACFQTTTFNAYFVWCLLKLVTRKKKETDTKLAEVTQRIRCLLRDRAKCFTNEWRQFARKITVSA